MLAQLFRKRIFLAIALALAVTSALALNQPVPAAAPPAATAHPSSEVDLNVVAAATVQPPKSSTAQPTSTTIPSTNTPLPTATAIPATPTPTIDATPTARPDNQAPRVGIQVGHWKSKELPDELARLRTSSGAFAAGYAEADVNLNVATRVVDLLKSHGVQADLIPATIPPGYDADAFVAIHADGSSSTNSRGFKLATPWRTSRAAQHLLDSMVAEYGKATGMPQDDAVTFNMRGYYAFNYRRHEHSIARTTPAVILEMGFLTNAADRAMMIDQADRVAVGIANGIVRYLNERDPNDGAALLPPEYKTQRPLAAEGVDIFALPRNSANIVAHVGPESRLFVFQERDGWYQVVIRGGGRITGWVRRELLTETNDPLPTPPPATDS